MSTYSKRVCSVITLHSYPSFDELHHYNLALSINTPNSCSRFLRELLSPLKETSAARFLLISLHETVQRNGLQVQTYSMSFYFAIFYIPPLSKWLIKVYLARKGRGVLSGISMTVSHRSRFSLVIVQSVLLQHYSTGNILLIIFLLVNKNYVNQII